MARVPLFHDSLSRCLLSPATALQRDTMGNLDFVAARTTAAMMRASAVSVTRLGCSWILLPREDRRWPIRDVVVPVRWGVICGVGRRALTHYSS